MGGITAGLREQVALLVEANARADAAIAAILDLAHRVEAADRDGAPVLLEAAEVIGRCEQARHGQLVRVLAQAERVKAHRGGLVPWIATHLDASDGRARAIAQSARWIGDLPHLAEPLSSGRVGADTIRALTRTARTVKGTALDPVEALAAVLETTVRDGVHAAKRQVQVLEETVDPGAAEERLAKQRARSFARSTRTDSGMTRFEVLLDPARATTVQAAIDLQAADVIRRRQYDHADPAPADVRTTEQINAHAVVRMAEVFLDASAEQRGATFTAPTLYTALLDGGMVETVYGELLPRTVAAPAGHPAAHLLEHDQDGEPVRYDGADLDDDPAARLASQAQRAALAWRDRHCTYPGCTRPPTWSLHAHHRTAHRNGGPTTMRNLTLYCSEHHTLTHHPDPK
jgi:hypothetical protein